MKPMLAKPRTELPLGDYLYEPKWDGFRCLIFRDGDSLQLQSRNEKPLNRYFPELVESMRRLLPKRCAVDGEIVIAGPEGLDFEALLQRVHPAASRVAKLSKEFPASFVAFDVLKPRRPGLFGEAVRRAESAPGKEIQSEGCALVVTEHSRSNAGALLVYWFEGIGFDGVVAKWPTRSPRRLRRAGNGAGSEFTLEYLEPATLGFRWRAVAVSRLQEDRVTE